MLVAIHTLDSGCLSPIHTSPVSQPISVILDLFGRRGGHRAHEGVHSTNRDGTDSLHSRGQKHEDYPYKVKMCGIRQKLNRCSDEVTHLLLKRAKSRGDQRICDFLVYQQCTAGKWTIKPIENEK